MTEIVARVSRRCRKPSLLKKSARVARISTGVQDVCDVDPSSLTRQVTVVLEDVWVRVPGPGNFGGRPVADPRVRAVVVGGAVGGDLFRGLGKGFPLAAPGASLLDLA